MEMNEMIHEAGSAALARQDWNSVEKLCLEFYGKYLQTFYKIA